MFHKMRNESIYGTNDLIDRFMAALHDLGPRDTTNKVSSPSNALGSGRDAVINWQVAGRTFTLLIDTRVSPVEQSDVLGDAPRGGGIPVLISPFVSRPAQLQLERSGFSYWDPTGNLLLQNPDPFLWIERSGATKNPSPEAKSTALRSLKGRAASEVIVKLLSNGRAGTARDLALDAGVGLGTASRVVTLLRSEDFFEPTGGGPLIIDDPIRLARRWAEDYNFQRTYRAKRYFSILGTDQALARIRQSGAKYALTGLAGLTLDYRERSGTPPLPANDLWLYTDDLAEVEKAADLVPDNANGNILVAETDFFSLGREGYRPIGDDAAAWPWSLRTLRGRRPRSRPGPCQPTDEPLCLTRKLHPST
jgi:hypothetical protein